MIQNSIQTTKKNIQDFKHFKQASTKTYAMS